jgi:hypothetical protein
VFPSDIGVLDRFNGIIEVDIDWGMYIGKAIRLLRLAHKPAAMSQEELASRAKHEFGIDGWIC